MIDGLRRERGVGDVHIAQPLIPGLEASNWGVMLDARARRGPSGRVRFRPAENLAAWMRRWSRKLPVQPYCAPRTLPHGGKVYSDELNALLIHTPALSMDCNYQVEARIAFRRDPNGWSRVAISRTGRQT